MSDMSGVVDVKITNNHFQENVVFFLKINSCINLLGLLKSLWKIFRLAEMIFLLAENNFLQAEK